MPRKKPGPLLVKHERWEEFTEWYFMQANVSAQDAAMRLVEQGVARDLAAATTVLRQELFGFFERVEKVLRAGVSRMRTSAKQAAGAKAAARPAVMAARILRSDPTVPAKDLAADLGCHPDTVRRVRRENRRT